MSSAKSLQVGATVSSIEYAPKETGSVSSTWGGGGRIDLAIALKTIEIIQEENLLKNTERMGEYFMRRLEELTINNSDIAYVRGLGLMIGVEMTSKKKRDYIVKEAFKNGLLMLGCGFKSFRIAPPLIITEKEAEKGLQILEKVLK